MLPFCITLSFFIMSSSRDQRFCPGVGGRKCGIFMSSVLVDPHPTCAKCRGRKCSSLLTCSICESWSLAQWEAFNKRRAYADRTKPRASPKPSSMDPNAPLAASPSGKASSSQHFIPPLSPPPTALVATLNVDDTIAPRAQSVSASPP